MANKIYPCDLNCMGECPYAVQCCKTCKPVAINKGRGPEPALYLSYQTKGGKEKEKFFSTESEMNAFILKSGCIVITWWEL